jgi:two-component system NtrC family sensor kinase
VQTNAPKNRLVSFISWLNLSALTRVHQRGGDSQTSEPTGSNKREELAQAFGEMTESLVWREETIRQLAAIVQSSEDAIISLTLDNIIASWNRGAERLYGYSAQDVLGRSAFLLVPPDRQEEEQTILRKIKQGESLLRYETMRVRKDGGCRYVSLTIPPIRNASGVVTGASAVAQDITERKQAEERLRESERRYRHLVENSQGLICTHTLDGTLLSINPAAAHLLGYQPEEMGGRNFREFLAPAVQPRFSDYLERIRHGETDSGLLRMITKTGDERIVVYRNTKFEEAGKAPYVLGHAQDITDLRRAEKELQRQREVLMQTEKLAAMGTLLAGVAHELNNPLAAVQGHTFILRKTAKDPQIVKRVKEIEEAIERCAKIVHTFVNLARPYPSSRQQIWLNKVVQEAVDLLAYQFRLDNIEVILDFAEDLPLIWADPHQLHEVMLNLLTNAQQAMRGASPPRLLTISTRLNPQSQTISLEIDDTGPGVPAEIRSRIFEPLFTTRAPGEGTGLGLSVSQGIIQSHGGTIELAEAEGPGAVFRIELPVERRGS